MATDWLPVFPDQIKNYWRLNNKTFLSDSFGMTTGHLRFIFDGNSQSLGTVQQYNDGTVNVPNITVKSQFPIVLACKKILTSAGTSAKTYKLDIIRSNVILFTIRSILWGTVMITGQDPAYKIIDRQLISSDKV